MAVSKLPKPSFQSVRMWWVNPDSISSEDRQNLSLLLPQSWMPEQKKLYLDAVSEVLSAPPPMKRPVAKTLEVMCKLQNEARRLRAALKALDEVDIVRIGPHYAELRYLPKYRGRLPYKLYGNGDFSDIAKLLGGAWDMSEALIALGEQTAAKIHVDKSTKPSKQAAKALVYDLATAHQRVFRRIPSGQWFSQFAEAIADRQKLKCGRDLIAEVLKKVRGTD